jgi:N-acetylmuramoyl-L-alanine amidase
MRSAEDALRRLRDPEAKVSAHYLIDEDGSVVAMVPEADRAWHAGVSSWRGRRALNDVSIGIELVNPGHEWGYRAFPEPQMAALVALARDLLRRWPIPPARVVGHSDVAPTRKQDPGELLDWQRLAREGIGIWPEAPIARPPDHDGAVAALRRIGYPLEAEDVPFTLALAAFQRRFRPGRVDGRLDAETMGRLIAAERLCVDAAGIT